MNRHRSREEIIADILSIVINEPKKTHIMYGANLSYSLLCKYLTMLMEAELVRYRPETRDYVLTATGKDYLDLYTEYKDVEVTLQANEVRFSEKRSALAEMLKGALCDG
jgi:predicted transcriptional regulator